MEALLTFFGQYGWPITIMAIVGVAVLGGLKYGNVFSKYDEQTRHFIYMACSIGLTALSSLVYLLIIGQFDLQYFVAVILSTYALNQTFYNIFKVTNLRELFVKLLDFLKELITGVSIK